MAYIDPITITPGQLALATHWNTYIRDNFRALRGGAVRKTADESVTSSTVLQDDNHLLLPIGANAIWAFTAFLIIDDLSGTADFKMTFVGPSGATGSWAATGGAAFSQAPVKALGTTYVFDGASPAITGWVSGTIVNSTTAGNLLLQWAQSVSNASATTLRANSWLKADPIT